MPDLINLKRDFTNASQLLIALGDEKRQAIIISLLADKACQGIQVSELTTTTNLSRPAVSHHLKILRAANLIDYRGEGTKNLYYLTHDAAPYQQLQQLLKQVTQLIDEEH